MSVIGNIRDGIVSSLTGTISYNQFTGYLLTPAEPPCFEIDFPADSYVYDQTFGRGMDQLELIVRGMVSLGEPDEGAALLDQWLDPTGSTSVKTALENDKTLGGAVTDMQVTRVSGHRRLLTPEGTPLLVAEWTVKVIIDP